MKFCLIGEKLGHSYSALIHRELGFDYSLKEIAPDDLPCFLKSCNFDGFNVTIPYKKQVMPYLSAVSQEAQKIGAVNTVINKNGKLYGYNTDYFGLDYALKRAKIELKGKNVLVLGSGGASQTAIALCKDLNAKSVTTVSRTGEVNYTNVYSLSDTQVIINATPVGMSPRVDELVLDLSRFPFLEGVFDLIYNPLKTELILQAEKLGVKAGGGLAMLVAQAVKAQSIWQNKEYGDDVIEKITKKLIKNTVNIVLIGMPSCGKSSIGKEIASHLNKEFLDSDERIEKAYGVSPKDMILQKGEREFRHCEKEIIKELSAMKGKVIATGGGVCLDEENVKRLKGNGVLIYVDRDLDLLSVENRPISQREGLKELYLKRKNTYESAKDFTLKNDSTVFQAVEKAVEIYENFSY